ncbi:transposase [Thermobifida halotolerans]|uniref:Transposase n=1 Tax=Thermobifida halotolerans TaxID=483545 RepID=A0AA97LZN7_9ACTN|nr:transposase [Thermobifida halotolerans]UOE21202.1 transposase [Thermobifida halotolerans]
MSVQGKKTVRKIVASSGEADPVAAVQSVQQFINQSPWEWPEIRRAIAEYVDSRTEVSAWVIDNAIIPKRGCHSVGVAKRFIPHAGKTINCQVGVGLYLATDQGAVPADWRLLIPDAWLGDQQRRSRAKIPDGVTKMPVWAHILDLTDTVARDWGLPPVPVIADLHCTPDSDSLISGLLGRGLQFLVEVGDTAEIALAAPARGAEAGRPAERPGPTRTTTVRHRIRSGYELWRQTVPVPEGGGQQQYHVASCVVHRPVRTRSDPFPSRLRLVAASPQNDPHLTRYWLTNLPYDRVGEVFALAVQHTDSSRNRNPTEERFGLRDFEGRSFPGWHHHMTLVSAAYAYDLLCRQAVLSPL